jgi:hypothetical protein
MYDFGKKSKEKARQQKQMAKAAKRVLAKQQKADLQTPTPEAGSDITEPQVTEQADKGTP